MKVERYAIYWVSLDPTIGSEMHKTCPAVVISDNGMNNTLKTVVVCPLTSSIHPSWRSRIQIQSGKRKSEIVVDQIRTISRQRLGTKIGTLSAEEALKTRLVITEMYGTGAGSFQMS